MHVVSCPWAFKAKLAIDGSLDRLKACLVVKGFHQKEGTDFLDTFSLVVQLITIRIVLFVATIHHCPISQFDINKAFLHERLKTINQCIWNYR